MQFERERYPTYVEDGDVAAVVAEQQRVLKAALPITSLQIVRGAMVDYGAGIASALAGAPVEVLVDISAAPELKTMLDAVRQATTPLDIDVSAQWTVTRSSEHWLALLATLLRRAVAVYGLTTPATWRTEGSRCVSASPGLGRAARGGLAGPGAQHPAYAPEWSGVP